MIMNKDQTESYSHNEEVQGDYELMSSLSLEDNWPLTADFSPEDARADFLRHLGETAAVILHEVRNPLQTARAFIQIMEKVAQKDTELAAYFPLILEELERADLLLKDYLRFTRQEASVVEPANIISLCRETVMLVRGGAALKEIILEENYPGQDIFLMLDAQRIRQVLLNLILNAFDACMPGGRVIVSVVPQPKEIWVKVEDNGCGMNKLQLKRIFDPFYTTKPKGTGLGLSLCYKIIHSHGGHLKVCSKLGGGTNFTIVLPRLSMV